MTAVASIAFLLCTSRSSWHWTTPSWIAAADPLRPRPSPRRASGGPPIGLGSLAGLLMIFVGITGALRNQFASPAPVAARWRAMHMLAYPAWCAALVHGLFAGRAAKPFFMISYELCLVGGHRGPRAARRPAPVQAQGRRPDHRAPGHRASGRPARTWRPAARASRGVRRMPGYGAGRQQASAPAPGIPARDADPRRCTTLRPAHHGPGARRTASRPPTGPCHPPAARQQPSAADQTARMDMPMDTAGHGGDPAHGRPRQHLGQLADPVPAAGRRGAPVGVRPDATTPDTTSRPTTIRAPPATASSDVYDTGETNAASTARTTRMTRTTAVPPTNHTPGAVDFDAPGSGEPWNTPSGGFK